MSEYEVECIQRAKVIGDSKGRPKGWTFQVKWKGYDEPEDNTWEPPSSFQNGSEHFIDHFWSRVNVGGRDVDDIREFSVDEEFIPQGPPRRKKGKKVEKAPPPETKRVESECEVNSVISLSSDSEEEKPIPLPRTKRSRPSSSAVVELPTPKRKRGPPGRRAMEVEPLEEMQSESKTVGRTRSSRNLRAEPTHSDSPSQSPSKEPPPTASRIPLPRRRGRPSLNPPPPSSPSVHAPSPAPRNNKPKAGKRGGKNNGAAAKDAMVVEGTPSRSPSPFGPPTLLNTEPEKEPSAEPVPLPRTSPRKRASTARVKFMEDPNLSEMSNAIDTKARIARRSSAFNVEGSTSLSTRSSRSKPGPGRSSSNMLPGGSRLTAEKGKLTTVKAKRSRSRGEAAVEQADEEPLNFEIDAMEFSAPQIAMEIEPLPPSGKELLDAAGLSAGDGDLPDFEEDAEGEVDLEYVPTTQSSSQVLDTNDRVEPAPQAPPILLEAKPVTFASRVTTAFGQSTIFGPLTLGISRMLSPAPPATTTASSSGPKIHLNLDPSISLKIALEDAHATESFLQGLDSKAKHPTGKFYKEQHAASLADSLRAEGSYARVELQANAGDEHLKHFERFMARLESGELFVQMNGPKILIICGSDNSALGQKFSVPADFVRNKGPCAVMVHVQVEDYGKYADAAVNADDTRW